METEGDFFMIHTVFYVTSWLFHLLAFYYGLKAWYTGDKYFCDSSVLHFFKSRIERKFWTVCLGTLSNAIFLILIPFYMVEFGGNSTGWMEPWFNVFHLSSAIGTAIWHHMTYEELLRKTREDAGSC